MTIKELQDTIIKKRYFFEVISNNPNTKFGRKTLEDVERAHGSFEEYLRKIAEAHKMKQVQVKVQSKNGTGFANKGSFWVEIVPVAKIDNIDTAPIKSIGSVEPIANTTIEKPIITPTPNKMDVSEIVKAAEDRIELKLMKRDNEALLIQNKDLQKKVDDYVDKITDLSRQVAVKGDETEIKHQRELLRLEKDAKGGLSGIVEELKNQPELLGTILSVFQPNNPIVKAMAQKIATENGGSTNSGYSNGDESLEGLGKHENEDAQAYIEEVYKLLISADAGNIGMIGALIEYFLKFPNHLTIVYKKFIVPGVKKDAIVTVSGSEEDNDENND